MSIAGLSIARRRLTVPAEGKVTERCGVKVDSPTLMADCPQIFTVLRCYTALIDSYRRFETSLVPVMDCFDLEIGRNVSNYQSALRNIAEER